MAHGVDGAGIGIAVEFAARRAPGGAIRRRAVHHFAGKGFSS
jgi:hypothetical protein